MELVNAIRYEPEVRYPDVASPAATIASFRYGNQATEPVNTSGSMVLLRLIGVGFAICLFP